MVRSTDECPREIYIVEGRCGEYEPSFWSVNAWTSREMAEQEAKRLEGLSGSCWKELKEFEEQYKDDMTDEQLGTYYDARTALLKRWADLSGDPGMETYYDECSYFVTPVVLKQ